MMKWMVFAIVGMTLMGIAHGVLPYDVKVEYDNPGSDIVVKTNADDVLVEYDGYTSTFMPRADGTEMITVPTVDEISLGQNDVYAYKLYAEEGNTGLINSVSTDFTVNADGIMLDDNEIKSMTVVDTQIPFLDREPADNTVIIVTEPST